MAIQAGFEGQLTGLLHELQPRQRGVIKRRYGIGGGKPETLEAIGQRENITRERVRQIENDAISKLKKSPLFGTLASHEAYIAEVIEKQGGVVSEEVLVGLPEFASVKDKRLFLFFLDICPSLTLRRADDEFYARWYTRGTKAADIERALTVLARDLERSGKTITDRELNEKLESHLANVGVQNAHSSSLGTYLALSKEIEKNTWGEYGHVSSPFVRPKGMRESAYVALSRAKTPLHFRDIAVHIGSFVKHPVHVQTVHNELIKDDRFVLVGRGLYALREWGYEPGFVKDVLIKLLSDRGAMTREEILAEIAARRQVKPSTIFINLQNKKLFKALDNGTYTLVS